MRAADALEKAGGSAGVAGISVRGRDIKYIKAGDGEKGGIIVTGGIHAREHVTAKLVVMQAQYAVKNPRLLQMPVYFVPLVNPDGAEIALLRDKPPAFFRGDARLYKANAAGVDLNVNFDAGWGEGAANVFYPSGANYVGPFAFSEPETAALRDFTLKVKPRATISYHAKGRIIYYDFRAPAHKKAYYRAIADVMAEKLHYAAVEDDGKSAGGYKDWCQQRLAIPAFTIEIGDDAFRHPLTEKDVQEDYARNIDLPLVLQKCLLTMKK